MAIDALEAHIDDEVSPGDPLMLAQDWGFLVALGGMERIFVTLIANGKDLGRR